MNTATLPAPVSAPATVHSTFTRLGNKARVTSMVKDARRVGYEVTDSGSFAFTVKDPTNGGALVFKSVNVRPGLWATTYSSAYFAENN